MSHVYRILGATSGTAVVPGSAELALQRGFVLVPLHLGRLWPGDRAGLVTLPRSWLVAGVGVRQEREEAAREQSGHVTGSDLSSPRLCHVWSSLGNAAQE